MAQGTCSIEGCGRGGKIVRGWCGRHYDKWQKYGDPLVSIDRSAKIGACSIGGCTRTGRLVRDMCPTHYQRWKTGGTAGSGEIVGRDRTPRDACSVEGCTQPPPWVRGMCGFHYRRLLKFGDPLRVRDKPTVCTIDGCGRSGRITRDMCTLHYNRLKKYGDPLRDPELAKQGRRREKALAGLPQGAPDECWPWPGPLRKGYGQYMHGAAHRVAYELLVGPIPAGMSLDHSCHTRDRDNCAGGDTCPHRRCVNPAHLQPMPLPDNTRLGNSPWSKNARKTHCVHGHPFDFANTYIEGKRRRCRTCMRRREQEYRERLRAAKAA